jgi:hypothetical protein
MSTLIENQDSSVFETFCEAVHALGLFLRIHCKYDISITCLSHGEISVLADASRLTGRFNEYEQDLESFKDMTGCPDQLDNLIDQVNMRLRYLMHCYPNLPVLQDKLTLCGFSSFVYLSKNFYLYTSDFDIWIYIE